MSGRTNPLRGIKEKIFGDNPRIENRRLLLTYYSQLDEGGLRRFISEVISSRGTEEIVVGIIDDDNDTYTHVYIDFGRVFISKKSGCERIFDYEESGVLYHPVIRVVVDRQVKRVLAYLRGEHQSKPVIGLSENNKSIPSIITYNMESEYHVYRRDIYNQETFDPSMNPWSQYILSLDSTRPHPRHIDWYWCKINHSIRDELADYMCRNFRDVRGCRWILAPELRDKSAAARLIQSELESYWTSHGIVINLNEGYIGKYAWYRALEDIKNGLIGRFFRVNKNSDNPIKIERPHVVVLSDKLPIFSKMSIDRWKIHVVTNTKSRTLANEATKQLIEYSHMGLKISEDLVNKLSRLKNIDDEFDILDYLH